MQNVNVTMEVKRGRAPIDGGELYWEATGEGSAVVMVHGFTLDRRMWEPQIDAFSRAFRMIRYDQRGYGRSSLAEPGVPVSHAEDLAQLLDALGIESAALVGASMGGQTALEFALRFPERVDAMVLVAAAIQGWTFSEEAKKLFSDVAAAYQHGGVEAAKASWLASPLFAAVLESGQAELIEVLVDEYSGWHWANESPNKQLDPPMQAQLSRIGVPTLVMVGEDDYADLRTIADVLSQEIEGAGHKVLDGLGHFPNLEDPLRFDALALSFLTRSLKADTA